MDVNGHERELAILDAAAELLLRFGYDKLKPLVQRETM